MTLRNESAALLDNYRQLLQKIDAQCDKIQEKFQQHISCKVGCDECCQHISVFPVEAYSIALALKELPEDQTNHIKKLAENSDRVSGCCLLQNHQCLLYNYRPIICRTHGFPILFQENGSHSIDFCPKNFQDLESIGGEDVINLDNVNLMLATIDRSFRDATTDPDAWPDRILIKDALLSIL